MRLESPVFTAQLGLTAIMTHRLFDIVGIDLTFFSLVNSRNESVFIVKIALLN